MYSLNDIFNFGKYKNTTTTIAEAIEDDLAYIEWCIQNVKFFKVTDEVFDLIELHLESISQPEIEDDYQDDWWHEGHPDNFGDR